MTTSDAVLRAPGTGSPDDLVAFSDRGRHDYRELKEFVYRHVIHSFPVSRNDGHARRVITGIFSAYRENPRLLPDYVLLGLHEDIGVRFLRARCP